MLQSSCNVVALHLNDAPAGIPRLHNHLPVYHPAM